MRKTQINIILTAGVASLLLLGSGVPSIGSTSQSIPTDTTTRQKNTVTNQDAVITCYTGGIPHTQTISYESGTYLKELFSALVKANADDPCSAEAHQLQQQILKYAEEQGLLPAGMSANRILTQLDRQSRILAARDISSNKPLLYEGSSKEFFCNFVSTGEGSAFPIIILPRFIPIIMAPIPRVFVGWKTPSGVTSVGGLISRTGFIASGQQEGLALGFWGIGFSIFLPPVMGYGMFGYALYAKVSAENMEYWPPNHPPAITQTDPVDGEEMVPMTTSVLRFNIEDIDGDLMSYSVTTDPDIGSDSGGLKPDGIYSVPISGLESLTTYTCCIEVTDDRDTTVKTFMFTTEPAAPILSNPLPPDGERDVPMDLSQLRFTLKDYQGDTMEYTVQTSPNIGSAQGTDVHDGTYTIPITGMTYGATYRWYVNVTDGVYWTRKAFVFETGYPTQFNPFDYGWRYRKQITIDHSQIPSDQTHFPMLIDTSDSDLSSKAQSDGGDIMFMNDIGVSTRLYHDLESFTSSSGTLLAWVDIPALSPSNDTIFYMYYGNPTCINQSYPEKTWDSNFEAVWHMNDATLTTISDSTSNMFTGTKVAANGPQQSAGKVGPSQDFDGTNDYIQFTNSIIPTGAKTISAWINRHSTGWFGVVLASSTGISGTDAGTAWSFLGINDTLQFCLGNGQDSGPHYMELYIPHPGINSWHYYTMTYDTTSLRVYIDGVLVGSTMRKSGTEHTPTYDLRMGETNHPSYDYYLDAGLDEIQISSIARSESWIQLSYAIMMNPSQFIVIGPEVPGK